MPALHSSIAIDVPHEASPAPDTFETMKRLVLALLIGALPVTVANAAPAPTVQEALDACRALENPLDRLACYDSIPGASVTGGAATTPAEAPADVTDGEVPGPLFGTPHDTPFLRSRMTRRWELDDATHGGLFRVRRHEPVYALPARFSTSPNERPVSPTLGVADGERLDAIEAKFQVSLKTKVWNDLVEDNGDVWVGFTQQSNWQAYNDIDSSPFRETNYSPEVWTTWRTGVDLPLMRWQMLNLGFVHQSNGQGGARSRSWNRVYATLGFERGDWELYVRPWLRVEPPGIDLPFAERPAQRVDPGGERAVRAACTRRRPTRSRTSPACGSPTRNRST